MCAYNKYIWPPPAPPERPIVVMFEIKPKTSPVFHILCALVQHMSCESLSTLHTPLNAYFRFHFLWKSTDCETVKHVKALNDFVRLPFTCREVYWPTNHFERPLLAYVCQISTQQAAHFLNLRFEQKPTFGITRAG
jgi:hypothetical protein